MATTAKGVPYPLGTDPNDGAGGLLNIATWVDQNPGVAAMTSAARAALAGAALWAGRVVYETDTLRYAVYLGAAGWRFIRPTQADQAWTQETPDVWGAPVTIAQARYKVVENTCHHRGYIVLSGPADSQIGVPLPASFQPHYTSGTLLAGVARGSGAAKGEKGPGFALGAAAIAVGPTNLLQFQSTSTDVWNATVPWTWAAGDQIHWSVTFEVD